MTSLQLLPSTQSQHPFDAPPRQALRPSRFGAIGTVLFFFTITAFIIGGGVAGLRYGNPDQWDPPAHGEQNATRPEAIAPVMAAALPDAPAALPEPSATPANTAVTKKAPKAKAKPKAKAEAPRKPAEPDAFATTE